MIEAPALPELTRETPAPGVVVWQPRRGYRYGVEVYALAAFALEGGEARTALDLGAGSGVVGLLLASRGVSVRSVERNPLWVEVARRGAAASGLPVEVVEADVREWRGPAVDLVVTNPPWFPPDQPLSPDPWKAASRAMLHGGVADFVEAGLRHAPRVCVVTRRERERDVRGWVEGSRTREGSRVWHSGEGGPGGRVRPPPLSITRRATLGAEVVLLEVREGEGETREVPLDLAGAYRAFGVEPPRHVAS